MKILWVIKKYLDVALDKPVRLEMIHALNRRGHTVTLLTGYKLARPDFGLGNSIKYMPTLKIPGLNHLSFLLVAMVSILRENRIRPPDVVILDPHTAVWSVVLRLIRVVHLVNYAIIMDIRTLPVNSIGIKGWLANRIFDLGMLSARIGCDAITVITPFMKEIVSEKYGFKQDQIGVWSSGVSINLFSMDALRADELIELRKKLNWDGKFIVLYHGALQDGRGLLDAVGAIHELILSGNAQDIMLVFLGSGSISSIIKQTASDFSAEDHVMVLDPVEHHLVPYYIALSDVGLLPFPDALWLRVSSPIKLGEYLSMGKPVIVTDIEAHRDVLGDSTCGVYVKPGCVHEIAVAIGELKALNTERRQFIGKPGREIAKNQCTWDYQAKRLENTLLHAKELVNR